MAQRLKPGFRFGEFSLNVAERRLSRRGENIPLTPKVFDTLLLLVENAGHLVEKETFLEYLWPDAFVEESSLAQNISVLRKALGDDRNGNNVIETVPKRGYRLVVEVRELGEAQASVADAAVHDLPQRPLAPASGFRFSRTGWIVIAISLGLLVAAIVLRSRAGLGQPPIRSLAVLPLQNLTSNPENEYLTDGMTDELITDLAKVGGPRVISHTSVMRYKGARKSLPEIARELNVDAIVEGAVQSSGGRIHVSAQLVQARPEKHLWAESYDRASSDMVALQSELAREIAGAIRVSLTPQQQARLNRKVSPEAYQLYLKGRYFWNKRTEEGFRRAIDYFQQAAAKEPDYAAAYSGLADSYLLLGGYRFVPQNVSIPKARAAAQKALELDGSLAEVHATLGLIAENYEWNWAEAERQYRQAIAFNPNYATAHHWYGEYLGLMGRFTEGLAEIRVAEALDPLSVIISNDHGGILLCQRQYDEAIVQFRKTLEMDPNFFFARSGLLQAEVFKGTVSPQDLAELENLREPAMPLERDAILAYTFARTGRRADAEKVLQHLNRLAERGDVDNTVMTGVYLGLGDKEKALAFMEREYAERSTGLNGMKVHPIFDPIRSDSRFLDLMRRVRLAE